MTMAAVGLSIAGSLQCQFFLMELTTGTGWDAILDIIPDEFSSIWVGVFQWGPAIDGVLVGECRSYESFFDNTPSYVDVAQACAIAAPSKSCCYLGNTCQCLEMLMSWNFVSFLQSLALSGS
jgi:hypothetical protein